MKNQIFLNSYCLKIDEKLKKLGVIRKWLEKISISQDSAKSKQITGEKIIYAEKQGPKIKSGSKKYDYPKDKTRVLTDTVKVYKKVSGLTEGILDTWWITIGICERKICDIYVWNNSENQNIDW